MTGVRVGWIDAKQKAPLSRAGLSVSSRRPIADSQVLVHAFHTAAAVSTAAHWSFLLLWISGTEGFGGQNQRGNRAGVGERGAHSLRRIEHARLDQVFVLAGQSVEAVVWILRVLYFAQNNGAFFAGVASDLTQRLGQSALHDVHADLLIAGQLELFERRNAANQGYAAAGDHAF